VPEDVGHSCPCLFLPVTVYCHVNQKDGRCAFIFVMNIVPFQIKNKTFMAENLSGLILVLDVDAKTFLPSG
jgi:hypothetical protein